MREMLARGKAVIDGEWIEGYYCPTAGTHFPCKPCIYPVEDINGNRRVVEIIPSTLGWETGLTDKNGTKIFEGDIIEFYFFDKTRRNGEFVEVKNTTTMLIEWYKSSFYMRELFRDYRLNEELEIITEKIYTYRGNKAQGVYESNSSYFVEVIGNIHDNPELLKGG